MTKDFGLAHVRAIAPYVGGRPISEVAREFGLDETKIVKLASNENPLGMPESAKNAMALAIADLGRYPDSNGFELKNALAKKMGVPFEWITLGNGSNDILELTARAVAKEGDEVIFSKHAFAVYPLATQAVGAKAIEVPAKQYGHDLKAMLAAVTPATRLIFVANPNNPTGTAVSISDIEELAKATAAINGLLVVDEAYAEFSNEKSAATLIAKYPNVLVSRTMSKAFAFAGVRLGYLAANKTVIDALQLVRLPYHLSALTQAAAEVALDFQDELLAEVSKLAADRDLLAKELTELGLVVIPSDANFILFGGFKASSHELWEKLLAKGVLIRDVGLAGYLRVTIGNEAENSEFLKALKGAL